MTRHSAHPCAGRTGWLRVAALLAALAALSLPWRPVAQAQSENLLDRITNERMQAFEERLTRNINAALSQYVSQSQYVLSVKVIWNQNILPAAENPALAANKQKLPGFPIFVRSPDAPNVDESTPPFVRMVVQVLLDETLPEYYERFTRKIVPIVARFDNNRGDQVIVLKETFPALPKGTQPSTLPEKELMEQLGERFPEALRPAQPQAPMVQPGMQPQVAVQAPAGAPERGMSFDEEARVAFQEGRYTDALRIVQNGFQRATTNRERAQFLGMEGSIYYTLNNQEAALASWKRAVVFDPSNEELHRVLNHLERQATRTER
ncbi:MAG: hypothetical protein HY342_04995 [Candidatus Lambdaproteobacteria bacterium]|nr:hypothetical protein [Candidatus Lambdaproteobacteria bacterium]